jgi:hypothetical protein
MDFLDDADGPLPPIERANDTMDSTMRPKFEVELEVDEGVPSIDLGDRFRRL